MAQPAGTVEGSLTLFRSDGLGGGEWWQCSRHTLNSRTQFWERIFKGSPERPTLVADRQTDEIWGRETADSWITTQTKNRLRSGFKLSQHEGEPGPKQLNEILGVTNDKTRTG